MAALIFWASAGTILYVYALYVVVIIGLAALSRNRVERADIEPTVTLLISAYNEERNIAKKLENTLRLDYPRDKLEVLVVSDGSTDATEEVVRGFADRGVKLLRVEGRRGKTEAQNQAVKTARGEIVVFSDATTDYRPDAVRKLVRNYHDPRVGAVSGRYEYVNPTGIPIGRGTVLFWKYENFIKSCQTRIKTITGCCGCIYSVRRDLYVPLPANLISDLVEPLKILEKGYRIVFEPEAVAYETVEETPAQEFSMRVRVIARGMNGLWAVRSLLNPFRHGFVAFQLISHKVLRWGVPFLLAALFLSTLALLGTRFYNLAFGFQAGVYGLALLGWVGDRLGSRPKLASLPLYFCVVNLASLVAFFKIIGGEKFVTWETVRR